MRNRLHPLNPAQEIGYASSASGQLGQADNLDIPIPTWAGIGRPISLHAGSSSTEVALLQLRSCLSKLGNSFLHRDLASRHTTADSGGWTGLFGNGASASALGVLSLPLGFSMVGFAHSAVLVHGSEAQVAHLNLRSPARS